MGNTSFIVSRTAPAVSRTTPAAVRDVLAEPRTQFAELTGAYWLEPIYAKLANEWDRQGRTVPGEPREHWRVPPDGSRPAAVPDRPAGPGGPGGPGTVGERDRDARERPAEPGGSEAAERAESAESPSGPAGRERAGTQDGRRLEGGTGGGRRVVRLAVEAPE